MNSSFTSDSKIDRMYIEIEHKHLDINEPDLTMAKFHFLCCGFHCNRVNCSSVFLNKCVRYNSPTILFNSFIPTRAI